MSLTKEQIMGIIRHTLTFAGGVLVAKGVIDDSQLTEIVGASMTLIGLIWSVVTKQS